MIKNIFDNQNYLMQWDEDSQKTFKESFKNLEKFNNYLNGVKPDNKIQNDSIEKPVNNMGKSKHKYQNDPDESWEKPYKIIKLDTDLIRNDLLLTSQHKEMFDHMSEEESENFTNQIQMTSFNDAYDDKFTPMTGGNLQVLESLHRTIGQLAKNCSNYYVGIASNGVDGCRSRWNSKYKDMNYTGMKPLYTTDSDKNRKMVEADLIQWSKDNDKNIDNSIGGGGGSQGTAPYIVYFAYKK